MKRLIAVLVLAMVFIGLTPLALAEGSGERAYTVNRVSDEAPEPTLYRQAEGDGAENASGGERVMLIQKRQIAQNVMETARQRFEIAKQSYTDARQKYADSQQRIQQSREVYKDCAGNQTSECERVRKQTKQETKNMLVHASDKVTSMIEKLRERIASAEELGDEEAAEKIAELQARIAEVENARSAIENLDNESSPDEIKDAANQIRSAWSHSQKVMKMNAGELVNAKIGGVIAKSERLQERLQNAVDELEEQGNDMSDAQELVDEFDSHIESAKSEHETAVAKYREARGREGAADSEMQEANRHMNEAHKQLKEGHAVLVKALRQIKSSKGGDKALADTAEDNSTDSADDSNS